MKRTTRHFALAAFIPLAGAATTGGALAPAVTHAADNSLYCFSWVDQNGLNHMECSTVKSLKAECKLTDPESTTKVCSDVNSMRIRGTRGALRN